MYNKYYKKYKLINIIVSYRKITNRIKLQSIIHHNIILELLFY